MKGANHMIERISSFEQQTTDTIISPALIIADQLEFDLASWSIGRNIQLQNLLERYGTILFRGFQGSDLNSFEDLVKTLFGSPMSYLERSSPRTHIKNGIYTSTEYPADQTIFFHNENSYQQNWPGVLLFKCIVPPKEGGETPLSNIRQVTQRLSPAILSQFDRKHILYRRNYGDAIGLPWQEAFQTSEMATVEQYCRLHGMEAAWLGEGRLRTQRTGRAMSPHKKTGEMLWFNHALFFNIFLLPALLREALESEYAQEDLPINTYYGDGSPIERDILAELKELYEKASTKFTWELGDVLLVDNMLTAHGRAAYRGERKIVVSMAEKLNDASD
jgi:alpha-ketoglutarate-dependent taurine dioxygenase